MCARFEFTLSPADAAEELNVIVPKDAHWAPEFRPFGKPPVIVEENGAKVLKLMQFSLIPPWSTEKKVKFSTYNARLTEFDEKKNKIVCIYEKPTWRTSFLAKHCLVPITGFMEPIYKGEFAGHWVRFAESHQKVLFAAGIWGEWHSKQGGEIIESFAIITDDPIPFVKKIGHSRSPLFLAPEAFDEWLSPQKQSPEDLVTLLSKNKVIPDLMAFQQEAMKPGWEKRVH